MIKWVSLETVTGPPLVIPVQWTTTTT